MSRTKSILLILSLFFLESFSVYDFPFTINERNESIQLFNGIDLSGWIIHGTEKWYAEDGELVCEMDQIINTVIYLLLNILMILY